MEHPPPHPSSGWLPVVLGAVLPLIVGFLLGGGLSATQWAVTAFVLVGYVGLLLASYGMRLVNEGPMPDDEPCLRSGSALGGHWFEFAGRPRRFWTHDAQVARSVRARPSALPGHGGFETVFAHPLGTQPQRHVSAALRTLALLLMGGMLTLVPLSLLPLLGDGSAPHSVLFVAVGGTAILIGAAAVYLTVFTVVYVLWNRALHPRQVERVVVTASQLHSDVGTLDLGEPGLVTTLSYTPYGARLELVHRTQRLILHGDHVILAAVERHLAGQRPAPTEGAELPSWVRHLQAGRARARSPE